MKSVSGKCGDEWIEMVKYGTVKESVQAKRSAHKRMQWNTMDKREELACVWAYCHHSEKSVHNNLLWAFFVSLP